MAKNLLTRIGEAIDQHWEEEQSRAAPPSPSQQHSRLSALARWFLPNGGTLLLVALLIFTQSVWAGPGAASLGAEDAASTGVIAYQGRIADISGNPINSTLAMSFRLYKALTGGTPLWIEQYTGSNAVPVSDGLFNVILGSLTPIPQNVITGNSTLFLGISVGTDDEMTPRVQLGSSPFAVQAQTVPNGSITSAKIADGAVTKKKIGSDIGFVPPDGSVTNAKIADGSVTDSKLDIYSLNVKNVGRFGTDGADPLEGGEIQLAAAAGGPRWHMDNYNNYLRWFSCQHPDCTVAMTLQPNGNWGVAGVKSSFVTTASFGQRKLYALETPDVRFSDEGFGRLENSQVRIELDSIFVETIEGDYLIHITPYGNASLYVAEIGVDYFVVRAREGEPDVEFAWRLSATRKGYADVRLEKVEDTK